MASLCLACFSTILEGTSDTYRTDCCNREICNSCLEKNPRLMQYNPCLACCRGMQVVNASGWKASSGGYNSPRTQRLKQDAAAFVIGEEDDDQETSIESTGHAGHTGGNLVGQKSEPESPNQIAAADTVEHGGPSKYWLKRGDTLQGIALRFKLNARDICKLNSLPFTTLSTTPHILHTRTFILLPPSNKPVPPPPADIEEREAQRRRERAAKKFQFVTKEVDWGVAKTYVALANDTEVKDDHGLKRKEAGHTLVSKDATEEAIDTYLDDLEWEKDQISAGVVPRIAPFPYFAGTSKT